MAVLAISALGAGIGSAIGGTFLGVAAASWGWMAGSLVGNMLFGQDGGGIDSEGPRLKGGTYTGDVEGTDMPILFGGDRMPGKPIFMKPPREVKSVQESGGGKGGGGGGSTYTTYTYYQDFALCFGDFTAPRPRRIWANNELIYDASGSNSEVISAGLSFSWYSGDDGQIDSLMEGYVGVGNCPAYNGRAIIVIDSLNLTKKFGNRIPVIEAELQTTGSESYQTTSYNMGTAVASSYTGARYSIRHPVDHAWIGQPWLSQNAATPLFLVEMAGRYLSRIYLAPNTINNFLWLTNPYLYDPTAADQIMIAHYHSTTGGTFSVLEYPSGKLIHDQSHIGINLSGGITMYPETQWTILLHARNLTTGFYVMSKPTYAIGSAYAMGDSETGFDSSDFSSPPVPIDWQGGRYGFFGYNTNINQRRAWYILTTFGPSGVGFSRISEPWLDYYGFDTNNWDTPSSPWVNEEAGEAWVPWSYIGTPTNAYDHGIAVFDIETGAIKKSWDFVDEGMATVSSYWGVASGTPHIIFDPESRRLWWTLSNGPVMSVHVDTWNFQVYDGAATSGSATHYYANRNSYWSFSTVGSDLVFTETKLGVVSVGTVAISTIIAAILERVGMVSTEYDVSALTSITIGSFIHSSRHSARKDIEILLGYAQADAVQSDNKIKFVLRGGAVDKVIPGDDLAAQEITGEPDAKDPISVTIPMEHEVPRVFEVQYRSRENNYLPGIVQSYIATGEASSQKTAQLPIALTDQQAGDVCEIYHQQILDPRVFRFDLPIKYVYFEPTDVFEVPHNGENHRVRLTKVDRGANWILQCTAILDNAEDQVASAVVPGMDAFLGTISTDQTPIVIVLDGPLLRDVDADHPGPYLAAFVYNANFPPSSYWYSFDDQSFTPLVGQGSQPIFGIVDAAHNTTTWEAWDDLTELTVTIINGGTLSSSTKSAIEADPTINAFAYGRQGRWEFLNAATVTTISTTPNLVYKLTNLLRGRRGTDNHIGLHQTKDYLLKINSDGSILRHSLQNSQIDQEIFYRLPTDEYAVSDVKSYSEVIGKQPLQPYSPIQVIGTPHTVTTWAASTAYALNDEVIPTTANGYRYVCTTAGTSGGSEPTWGTTIDGTTNDNTVVWTCKHAEDFDIAWTRRSRKGGSLGGDNTLTDGVGGPINEDSEAYEIDFTNKTTGAVLATVQGLTTNAHEYLGTQQATDGTDALGQFYMDVYQMSAVVGRGFRGRGLYDRGWGAVVNAGIDLGAKILFPLDDAGGANAKDWVSATNKGTFTSSTQADGAVSDNRRAFKADGTGYMKAGTNMRDLLTGKTAATVVYFLWGGYQDTAIRVDITKGGATSRCRLYDGAGYVRAFWGASSGTGILGVNGSSDVNRMNGRVVMAHTSCNLTASLIQLAIGLNGASESTTQGGSGHLAYAGSFQNQTRDANYNDTTHGSIAVTPTNIPTSIVSGGAGAMVMVFDRKLSLSELRSLYLAAHQRMLDWYDSKALLYHNRLDTASPMTPRVGVGNLTALNTTTLYPSVNTGSEFACYQFLETTSRLIYMDLPSSMKLQTFSISFWWATFTQYLVSHGPTGNVRLVGMSPRDWNNGSQKRGLHVHYNTTNGVQLDIGTGGASFSNISSGSANISGGTYNHIVVTVDATNGVNMYVNGSSVGTPLSALSIDWSEGTGGGPNPGQLYLMTDNSNVSVTSTNFLGCRGLFGDFAVFEEELTAAEVLELYNIGTGKG